ncbi:hypothetical protein BsWGS_12473 [Bradybaena similaris]
MVSIRDTDLVGCTCKGLGVCVDQLLFDESLLPGGAYVNLEETRGGDPYPNLQSVTQEFDDVENVDRAEVLSGSTSSGFHTPRDYFTKTYRLSYRLLQDDSYTSDSERLMPHFQSQSANGMCDSSDCDSQPVLASAADTLDLKLISGNSFTETKSNFQVQVDTEAYNSKQYMPVGNKVYVCDIVLEKPRNLKREKACKRRNVAALEENIPSKSVAMIRPRRNILSLFENKNQAGLVPTAPPADYEPESDSFSDCPRSDHSDTTSESVVFSSKETSSIFLASPGGASPNFPGTVPAATVPESSPESKLVPKATVPESFPESKLVPAATVPESFPGSKLVPKTTIPESFPGSKLVPALTVPESFPGSKLVPKATIPEASPGCKLAPEATFPDAYPGSKLVPKATIPEASPGSKLVPKTTNPESSPGSKLVPKTRIPYSSPRPKLVPKAIPEASPGSRCVPKATIPESSPASKLVPKSTIPESSARSKLVPKATIPDSSAGSKRVPKATIPESSPGSKLVPKATIPDSSTGSKSVLEATISEYSPMSKLVPKATIPESSLGSKLVPKVTITESTPRPKPAPKEPSVDFTPPFPNLGLSSQAPSEDIIQHFPPGLHSFETVTKITTSGQYPLPYLSETAAGHDPPCQGSPSVPDTFGCSVSNRPAIVLHRSAYIIAQANPMEIGTVLGIHAPAFTSVFQMLTSCNDQDESEDPPTISFPNDHLPLVDPVASQLTSGNSEHLASTSADQTPTSGTEPASETSSQEHVVLPCFSGTYFIEPDISSTSACQAPAPALVQLTDQAPALDQQHLEHLLLLQPRLHQMNPLGLNVAFDSCAETSGSSQIYHTPNQQEVPHQQPFNSELRYSTHDLAPWPPPGSVFNSHGHRECLLSLELTVSQFTARVLKPLVQLIHQSSKSVSQERLQELISHAVNKMMPEANESIKFGLKNFLFEELSQLNSESDLPVPPERQHSSDYLDCQTEAETSKNRCWLSKLISLLPNLNAIKAFISAILGQLTQALVAEFQGLASTRPAAAQDFFPEMEGIQRTHTSAPGHSDALAGQNPACSCWIEKTLFTNKTKGLSAVPKDQISERQLLLENKNRLNKDRVSSDISGFNSVQKSQRFVYKVVSDFDLFHSACEPSSTSYSGALCIEDQLMEQLKGVVQKGDQTNSLQIGAVIDNIGAPETTCRRRYRDDVSQTSTSNQGFQAYKHPGKDRQRINDPDYVLTNMDGIKKHNKNIRSLVGVHSSSSALSVSSETSRTTALPKDKMSERQLLLENKNHFNKDKVSSGFNSVQKSQKFVYKVVSDLNLFHSACEPSSTLYLNALCIENQLMEHLKGVGQKGDQTNSLQIGAVIENIGASVTTYRRRYMDDVSETSLSETKTGFQAYKHPGKARHRINDPDYVLSNMDSSKKYNKNIRSIVGVHSSSSALSVSSKTSETSFSFGSLNKLFLALNSAKIDTCGSSNPDRVSKAVSHLLTGSYSYHCEDAHLLTGSYSYHCEDAHLLTGSYSYHCEDAHLLTGSYSYHCSDADHLAWGKLSASNAPQRPRKLSSYSEEYSTSMDECFSEMEYNLLIQDTTDTENLSQESGKCHRIQSLKESLIRGDRTSTACSVDSSSAGVDIFPYDCASISSWHSSHLLSVSSRGSSSVVNKQFNNIFRPTPVLSMKFLSLGEIASEASDRKSSDKEPHRS